MEGGRSLEMGLRMVSWEHVVPVAQILNLFR